MSENQYPNVGNEPLLGNYQAPPPPPPPPQNNPYNVPNANPYNAPNANPYNVPNANPYNAPNPSFHNNQNPSFHNNPNPSFNNANMQPIYRPGNAPYNQGQVVASVGNHQIISNNGGVYYNPPMPGNPIVYGAMNPQCPMCRRETSSITRRVPGGTTWIWCFVLFILTGFCCCIPFCVDSCQDTEVVCVSCQFVKSRIQANCC